MDYFYERYRARALALVVVQIGFGDADKLFLHAVRHGVEMQIDDGFELFESVEFDELDRELAEHLTSLDAK